MTTNLSTETVTMGTTTVSVENLMVGMRVQVWDRFTGETRLARVYVVRRHHDAGFVSVGLEASEGHREEYLDLYDGQPLTVATRTVTRVLTEW